MLARNDVLNAALPNVPHDETTYQRGQLEAAEGICNALFGDDDE